MPSKQITDRLKSANLVAASAEANANAIGAALSPLLSSYLQSGESPPDVAMVARIIGRHIAATGATMKTADAAHDAEQLDDAAPRQQRDDASQALYERLVELREVVTGIYGAKAADAVGLSGTTPNRDALALSRFSEKVEGALRAGALPAPRVRNASVDAAETAVELAALRAPVDAALAEVARETREAQATLSAKNAATDSYDAAFAGAARALEGILVLAGRKELADRVRPSSRRPGQTEVEPEPDAPAAPATATGG